MQKFDFAELNIVHRGSPEQTLNVVRRAVRMGYDAVVISMDIGSFDVNSVFGKNESDESQQPPKKKKKRKKEEEAKEEEAVVLEEEVVPDPFLIAQSQLDLSSLEANGRRFRQFSRLTVSLDMNSIHKLQHNPKVKLYDLVAVRVPDEQVLLTLQRKGDFVDLVTLDERSLEAGRSIPWLYKQKIVQSCIAVGIHFELCYAHALQSSERRRQFFATARKLMEITRGGRGVVFSSGTSQMISLRAPYDVSNLSTLFGLPPKNGRKFVSDHPREVILRSQTRKTIKGALHVADLADPNAPIPSATGQKREEVLQQLAKCEAFREELAGVKEIGRSMELVELKTTNVGGAKKKRGWQQVQAADEAVT